MKALVRVARHRGVVVRIDVADHRSVGVGDGRIDHEAVVVDDRDHLAADGVQPLLEHAPPAIDVVARAQAAGPRD